MDRISVLVIAHNEEQLIGKCLDSLMAQTQKPDEIALIAHNCTDRTEEIASQYPIKVMSYSGPIGHLYARIKGFEVVTGEIVCCTDGDSWVEPNWINELSKAFSDPKVVVVSSPVVFTNLAYRQLSLSTFRNFALIWFLGSFDPHLRSWALWGPSFAVRKAAYEKIGGLEPMTRLPQQLGLTECPDDFYLACMLQKVGKPAISFKTTVRAISKQDNLEDLQRSRRQQQDGWKLYRYLKALQLPHEERG